jgi:hypothetical protein
VRGEVVRREAGPGQPAGERPRDHDPQRTAGQRGGNPRGQRLTQHQPACLPGGGADGPQQAQFPPPGRHGVGEGARHHEDRHEPGQATGDAEQRNRDSEQVCVRIGLGGTALVAGEHAHRLAPGGGPDLRGKRPG